MTWPTQPPGGQPPPQQPAVPPQPPAAPAYPPQPPAPAAPGYAQPQPPAHPGYPPTQPPGYAQPQPQAPAPTAGIFNDVPGATASQNANYTRPGRYIVIVQRLKVGVSTQNGAFFAVEMKCIAVLDTGGGDLCHTPQYNQPKVPHRPGEEMTDMIMKKHISFAGNVKKAIADIAGMAPESVTLEVCNTVSSDAQPCANTFMEVEIKCIPTRTPGRLFTKTVYCRRVPAAEVKAYFQQTDPTGMLEQQMLPCAPGQQPLLDQLIAFETGVSAPIAPAAAPAQPQAPYAAPPPAAPPPVAPPVAPAVAPAVAPGPFPGAQPPGPAAVPPPVAPPPAAPAAAPAFTPGAYPGPGQPNPLF